MLDAAHRKGLDLSIAPRKEDIVESIIFKASDVVVVTFKDVDLNFARKGTEDILFCLDTRGAYTTVKRLWLVQVRKGQTNASFQKKMAV